MFHTTFFLEKNMKKIIVYFAQVLFIVCITIMAVIPFSCRFSSEGINVIGGDYQSPILKEIIVDNVNYMKLRFSEPVSVKGTVVSMFVESESDSNVSSVEGDLSLALKRASGSRDVIPSYIANCDETNTIKISFENETAIGQKYELFGIVEDSIGNSLTFCVPFYGYNERIPKLIMTEILPQTVPKGTTVLKNEFIEFIALEDGNLGGIEVCSGSTGDMESYCFPSIEVKKNEIFVLHTQTRGEGCISETGEDLTLATSGYTSPTVRDLWLSRESGFLGNESDVIIIRNKSNKKVLDGCMFRTEAKLKWTKYMEDYAKILVEAGIYSDYDIDSSVLIEKLGSSSKKSIQRENINGFLINLDEYPINSANTSWFVGDVNSGSL